MRRWVCCWVVMAGLAPAQAAEPTLAEARQRWLRGNTAEARDLYETLAKSAEPRVPAAIGLSRVRESEGEYDRAAQTIDAALVRDPRQSDLLARRAELHYLRGDFEAALRHAEQALERSPEHYAARWVRARVRRDRGERDKADADFRWFVRHYTARDQAGQPIRDPEALLIIAQAGAENARWHHLSDQFRFILNEVCADALKADPDFWPAETLAGMLLLEKYNRGEAQAAFDKALKINPRAVEALVGKGRAALQQLELAEAEQFAEQALAINPRSIDALLLAADLLLLSSETAEARQRVEAARAIHPRDEGILGRLAACQFLSHQPDAVARLAAEVEKVNPSPGRFYFELAERLDDRRLFADAERFYKKALELWPQLPGVRNQLGLLALRMGREDEARAILAEAFASDPFNVRVANSLKVLRHLERYETLTTPHFLIRFDPKTDAVLARVLAEDCERIHGELSRLFDFAPSGPILIELFNSHEMFSGRVVGIPDLHTIGACTGRMVALVSPRGQGVRKPFNWGRVIRHELVHIFNLAQTNFQVPHWLTEGLAVRHEGTAPPPAWNQLLAERLGQDQLLDLGSINLGFMRPRSPSEWTLAYAQAHLYVEYLAQAHGPRAIAGLLEAYRDGLDTSAALKRVAKVEPRAFEAGYREFLRGRIQATRGRAPEKPMTLAQLETAVEKQPGDLELAGRLAEQYWKRRRLADARDRVEKILALAPKNGPALYLKAQILGVQGDEETALRLLEEAAAQETPDPRALKALGKRYFESGLWDKAEKVFERGRSLEPFEVGWLEDLARVARQSEDPGKRLAALAALAPFDPDDLGLRRDLAELSAAAGRWAEVERWAREGLEIDVLDAKARDLYLKSLVEQRKTDQHARFAALLKP